jgi:hypothetical protein
MLKKIWMLGLLSATTFGLISTPASAQNVSKLVQDANQSATQVGNGNFALQDNFQIGIVKQNSFSEPNATSIIQKSNQTVGQVGNSNVGVQLNRQINNILQPQEN